MLKIIQILILFFSFGLVSVIEPYTTLDTEIEELNGHTLREVFEYGNLVIDPYFEDDTKWVSADNIITENQLFFNNTETNIMYPNIRVNPIPNTINGNTYYARLDREANPDNTVILTRSFIQLGSAYYPNSNSQYSIKDIPNFSSIKNIYINNTVHPDEILSYTLKSYHVIDMSALGIENLLRGDMDNYYLLYKELVENGTTEIIATEITLWDILILTTSLAVWWIIFKGSKKIIKKVRG